MVNLSKEEKISKLNSLINDGESLLETKSHQLPDFSYGFGDNTPRVEYYTVVNQHKYPGWRATSILILKTFFGKQDDLVTDFENNCKISATENNLNQGLGILKTVKTALIEGYISEDSLFNEEDAQDSLQTITDKKSQKRISLENLPTNISSLIDELNDNLDRNNFNASALSIRKILTLSCFVALDKVGKSNMIENKELNDVLNIVQKELKKSDRVMAKVKSAKWIGDSANHSYKIKINESDVEVAATGLRIFLEEIF